MHVVYIHSTSLSSQKAHWVQILNTAHALARVPGTTVWLLPRTFAEGAPEAVLRDMGLSPLDTLRFVPTVSHTLYTRLGLHGDLLANAQRKWGQWLALRTLRAVMRSAGSQPPLVLTRNQDLPDVAGDVLRRHRALLINEHHKFEYVRVLEAKLQRKRPGRRTLAHFKQLARDERAGELRKLALFDGVVCTTAAIRDRLLDLGYGRPTVVIPNGAPLDSRTGDIPAHEAEKDIDLLYVGQLYRWKNVDLLIEALAHLPGRELTVVGGDQPGDFERLHALAVRHQVEGRVHFLGHQPHVRVKDFMRRARLGVIPLPSRGFHEARFFTCPLKALEMMAAGTPIVASRLRSLQGLLEDGGNAVLVEPDDARALAGGIRRLLEDERLRRRVIDGGRQTARELSYDGRAKRILEFAEACRART